MKLKFRAWYVLAEEMIDEILMISFVRKEIIGKFSDGSTSVPLKFEDKRNGEDVVLMQSTGLKDKNGKEIFEGDIVQFSDSLYTVFYDNEKGSYRLKPHDDRWNVDYMSNFSHGGNFEVVGNIYENKEHL
ncbi:YopX family protein [Streptococcus oralis]|uniref:YopX family protein n=1 Tax=Streptococcus oralis TaxID=1303 RepID=UPI001BAEFC05|nr:YopX family protein [Streptococcus oralis]MBS3689486.1 hypothetical protein [Streptococcus oralis]